MAEPISPPPAERVQVIAEVAQAHDGSLGIAHAYIDAVAQAGADVVKFQTHHRLRREHPPRALAGALGPRTETRYEYWKRMEFSEPKWLGLRTHALKAGWTSSPRPSRSRRWSCSSGVGVMGWKVASGEVRNLAILNRMAATHLPVFLSTGMSQLVEIDEAVALLRDRGVEELTVMQCT